MSSVPARLSQSPSEFTSIHQAQDNVPETRILPVDTKENSAGAQPSEGSIQEAYPQSIQSSTVVEWPESYEMTEDGLQKHEQNGPTMITTGPFSVIGEGR